MHGRLFCVCVVCVLHFQPLGFVPVLLYSWVSFYDGVKRKAPADDARTVLITLAPKHLHAQKDSPASPCSGVRFLTQSSPGGWGGKSLLVSGHRFRRKALFLQTVCTLRFVDCGLFLIARIGSRTGGYTQGVGVEWSQKANQG